MSVPYFAVGNTHRFRTNPMRKDGAVYNLTGTTVSLLLIKPDGTVLTKAATLDDAANGVASYTTTTTDFDTAGIWKRQWKVVDGSIVLRSAPVAFEVQA